MPSLTWPSKDLSIPQPAALIEDSIIYPDGRGYPDHIPENRLILGDNLGIMAGLLPEFEGRIDLIYADPPFFTNRKYSARIGRGEDSRHPEAWALAEGYPDSWPNLNAYLDFLYPRLAIMRRLLSESGTMYLHLDWHANSYARTLLDEIFGSEHLLNEIIWTYHGPSPIRSAFNRKHDTILAYVKSDDYVFNADAVRQPYNSSTVKTFKASTKAGFGKIPNLARGKVPEDWWYFPVVARLHNERTGYPTQKPENLLERMIEASSNPGGIVADFFCGSGTAPAVAARLGRKFIAADNTFRAVQTPRQRLCTLPSDAFTVERDSAIFWPLVRSSGNKLSILPDSVNIRGKPHLEYWEIDPAWDGKIFKSAAQASRPIRTGAISHEIRIKTGRRYCIRFVTAGGELIQQESGV